MVEIWFQIIKIIFQKFILFLILGADGQLLNILEEPTINDAKLQKIVQKRC